MGVDSFDIVARRSTSRVVRFNRVNVLAVPLENIIHGSAHQPAADIPTSLPSRYSYLFYSTSHLQPILLDIHPSCGPHEHYLKVDITATCELFGDEGSKGRMRGAM